MKEAAARDAAAANDRIGMRQQHQQEHHRHHPSHYDQVMDLDASIASMGVDSEQLGLLRALQDEEEMMDDEERQMSEQQQYMQQQKFQHEQQQQHQEIMEMLIQQNPNLLQEMSMMGIDPNDPESVQSLLQLLAQQEQENVRPEEHYLTIAQNGMILEATKTVTGFPPDALLMTSA